MEDFLLLGQVPGTTFTITFGTWLLILGWVSIIGLAWHALKHRKQLELIIASYTLLLSIRRQLR